MVKIGLINRPLAGTTNCLLSDTMRRGRRCSKWTIKEQAKKARVVSGSGHFQAPFSVLCEILPVFQLLIKVGVEK